MSEMIERVARAQYENSSLAERPNWAREPASIQDAFRKAARVAI